jgi:hypothetical protein
MVGGGNIIHNQRGNGIMSPPTGGRGMEKLRVLVAFQGKPYFCSGSPVEGALLDGEVESIQGEGAEEVFSVGEGAPLLQEIKEVDKNTSVLFPLRGGGDLPGPVLALGPAEPEASHNPSSGI